MPTALITGITGQDGSYLAEFLLAKGYKVVGMTRRTTLQDWALIQHIQNELTIVQADLLDQGSLYQVFETYRPDEIYNLGGQSNVQASWSQAVLTGDSTGLGVTRLLECMRKVTPGAKFYQASTSEMFGLAPHSPQNEQTPLNPRNPYGIAKVYGHLVTKNYRQRYGLFAVSGILFNHESPRRGLDFVTRKITHAAAQIKLGLREELHLGNLEAVRDWGFAGDYVRAMWMMLQQEKADDFVIGTGVLHSVRDLCVTAFDYLDLDYAQYVRVDHSLVRPLEPYPLCADASHAREVLGWQPEVDFKQLIQLMVDSDIHQLTNHQTNPLN